MSILKLLEDPFGPYPDFQILNPDWPRRGGPITRPVLTSVHMKCGGTYIGLDETELLKEAPSTSRIVKYPVEVWGVLEIEKLDWLSETGKKWLSFDLRKRDNDLKIAGKPSQLSLEAIYGDGVNSGSTISVWLKFEKILGAAYMTLDDDPTALVLRSADRNRSFSIDSLDVGTLELSRNFLERYRTRRLIQELIDGSDTPIQNRNIDWLVNQYLAQVIPMDKYLRIIYNPHIPNPVHNKRGDLVLKKPRHIRKVHKPQVREIFARQAEWLLADQIASSSPNARYLNIVEWRNFVLQVKIARREARAQNQRWGEPWNEEMHGDWAIEEGIDLTRFGGTWQEWQRLLRNALHNPIPWQQRKEIFKVPKPSPSVAPPVAIKRKTTPQEQEPPARKQESPKVHLRRVVSVDYQYDSDFSEASTPPETDSESENDHQHDRKLADKIPWYCCVPPTLGPTQHIWRCPGCDNYQINLLEPDEDELEDIPDYYAQLLRSKEWTTVSEPNVLVAFGHLVNNHYNRHLRALGIQAVTNDNEGVHVRKWPDEKKRKSRRLSRKG